MAAITIDTKQWNADFKKLREFEPALARAMRRNLKQLGGRGVEAVQRTVRLPPPTHGDSANGSREEIAANTKLVVSFTARSAGIKITTRGGSLGNFPAGYNQKTPFRHKVFGQNVWVQQQGRPFFGASLNPLIDKELLDEMQAAVDESFKAIGARP